MKTLNLGILEAYQAFALEEAFLEIDDIPILLLWRTPRTVMLGRFQNPYKEVNLSFLEEKGIALVRRNSGGGAIYTDPGILQFSFIAKKGDKKSFKDFMDPVVEVLREKGIPAVASGRNDILVGDQKVCGNAQYETKKGLLHHGSILVSPDLEMLEKSLKPSVEKLQSKGVDSVRGRVGTLGEYGLKIEDLIFEMEKKLSTGNLEISKDLESRSKELEEKFLDPFWTYGKVKDGNILRRKKYPSGEYVLHLNVEEGKILQIFLEGDFFLKGELKVLYQALEKVPYERKVLEDVLEREKLHSVFHNMKKEELLSLIID